MLGASDTGRGCAAAGEDKGNFEQKERSEGIVYDDRIRRSWRVERGKTRLCRTHRAVEWREAELGAT